MLKVLHFSNKPPFPSKDGGCIAISDILEALLSSSELEVFHFTLHTHKHPFDLKAYPDHWKNKIQIETAFINTKPDVFNALKCLFTNTSYNVARFYSKTVEKKIEALLKKVKFDTAILETIYLLPYLHLFKNNGIKVIVRTHNAEHQIWATMTKNSSSPLKKWYFKQLTKQLKAYEKTECAKVDGIISITEEDATFFKSSVPHVDTIALPTSFEVNEFPQDYSRNDFYFLGAMDWLPNKEALQWLLKNVMPNGLGGKNCFYIAGRNLGKNEFQHPDVKNKGEVKSSTDFIYRHGICLIPLQSGGGLKIKLIENMSLGKPIITTSEGARGVHVTHQKEVLIANTPSAFKKQMKLLESDADLREKLGQNARQFIREHFNRKTITKKLIEFIK